MRRQFHVHRRVKRCTSTSIDLFFSMKSILLESVSADKAFSPWSSFNCNCRATRKDQILRRVLALKNFNWSLLGQMRPQWDDFSFHCFSYNIFFGVNSIFSPRRCYYNSTITPSTAFSKIFVRKVLLQYSWGSSFAITVWHLQIVAMRTKSYNASYDYYSHYTAKHMLLGG